MLKQRINPTNFVLIFWLLLMCVSAQATIDAVPIVYTGQQAEGAPPGAAHTGNFTSNSNPALGGDSRVYYTSSVNGVGSSGSGEGLWRGDGTNTTNFWIINDPTPSPIAGFTFNAITVGSLIVPNDVGQTAFIARIEDALSNRFLSIWAGAPDALGLVAREDDPAPGTSSTFTGNFRKLLYNNAGQVAFQDDFEGTRQTGIWSGAPGSIEAVALEGEPAPGLGAGATFFSFSLDNHPLAMNDNGELAFYSKIAGITGNPETIWVGRPGNISAVAVGGQPAPGTNNQSFNRINRTVDINNNGAVGFRAELTEGQDSLWFGEPGNLSAVTREGEHAPGLAQNVVFQSFGDPVINDQDDIAFLADISRGAAVGKDRSLWVKTASGLQMIAKQDDQAPGFDEGTFFSSFTNVSLNNRGQVAFGGVVNRTESGRAVFATDGTNKFNLIARAGDTVNLGAEGIRTIDFVDLFRIIGAGSLGRFAGSSDGRATSFNDQGDLMLVAVFEEGNSDSGIFLTNIPVISPPVTPPPTLISDIDGNGQNDALTDGLLIIRFLFGLSGSALTEGAIGAGSSMDSAEIIAFLTANLAAMDVDGNGSSDALTDGLLIIRYLFGIRGSALISGAIGPGATRTTISDIENFLQDF